jgi:hypothetical protein
MKAVICSGSVTNSEWLLEIATRTVKLLGYPHKAPNEKLQIFWVVRELLGYWRFGLALRRTSTRSSKT